MTSQANLVEPKSAVSKTSFDESDMASVDTSDRYRRFDEFFSDCPEDLKVCIVMQHTPDPDAIGSALGLGWLLECKYGLMSDIYYAGQISHAQNQTEVNVLNVQMKQRDDFDPTKYSTYVTVDTVPQNTGFEDLIDEWHCVFDHHQFELDLPVTDIRACGACSSIIWDYIREFEMDFSTERGAVVATALLFGIVNDTHQFGDDNVSNLDRDAWAALHPYIDTKKYRDILDHPLPPYLFKLRALAAENMVSEASILISYLGILSDKRRDALPIISDEFLRMEGVETVVVFAMIDGCIQASVRSRNSSVNVHTFCQKVFGPDVAGGKQGAGGAKVPIGFLYSPDDDDELREKLSGFVKDTLTKRIIRHLSGA